MDLELLWLLLPVAAASGYWVAKRELKRKASEQSTHDLPRDYYKGLNYILNEQPEKAIDVFLKLSELDSSSLDLHLALGSLFRKRGEVDRAIRVHQALINHPSSNTSIYKQALQELSHDYMSAGLLDRAEKLCLELLDVDDKNLSALRLLRELYQQEKEWFRAIDIVRRIIVVSGEQLQDVIAHYYCEMAEEALSRNDANQAMRMLDKALQEHGACVRAIMQKAEIERQAGNYPGAVAAYQGLVEAAPEYLSEVLGLMKISYQALGEQRQFVSFLKQIFKKYHSVELVLSATRMLRELEGEEVALDFLAHEVVEHPSLRGIQYLLEFEPNSDGLSLIKASLEKLLTNKPIYRCDCCGFTGKEMHWCCPSCKRWSSIKPIQEFHWGASI